MNGLKNTLQTIALGTMLFSSTYLTGCSGCGDDGDKAKPELDAVMSYKKTTLRIYDSNGDMKPDFVVNAEDGHWVFYDSSVHKNGPRGVNRFAKPLFPSELKALEEICDAQRKFVEEREKPEHQKIMENYQVHP